MAWVKCHRRSNTHAVLLVKKGLKLKIEIPISQYQQEQTELVVSCLMRTHYPFVTLSLSLSVSLSNIIFLISFIKYYVQVFQGVYGPLTCCGRGKPNLPSIYCKMMSSWQTLALSELFFQNDLD